MNFGDWEIGVESMPHDPLFGDDDAVAYLEKVKVDRNVEKLLCVFLFRLMI